MGKWERRACKGRWEKPRERKKREEKRREERGKGKGDRTFSLQDSLRKIMPKRIG